MSATYCEHCGIQLAVERASLGYLHCPRCAPQRKVVVSQLGYSYQEPPPQARPKPKAVKPQSANTFRVWSPTTPRETFTDLNKAWEYAQTLDYPKIYGVGIGMIWPRSDRVGSTHTKPDWCVHPKNPRGNVIHCKMRKAKKLC